MTRSMINGQVLVRASHFGGTSLCGVGLAPVLAVCVSCSPRGSLHAGVCRRAGTGGLCFLSLAWVSPRWCLEALSGAR